MNISVLIKLFCICTLIFEPRHEKTCLCHMRIKRVDQPAHPRSLISVFVVRCLDSIISLVSISKISSLYLATVAAQTPKTGFLVTRLILSTLFLKFMYKLIILYNIKLKCIKI